MQLIIFLDFYGFFWNFLFKLQNSLKRLGKWLNNDKKVLSIKYLSWFWKKFWKIGFKSHSLRKLFFCLFSLIFVILLGQMHKNMQNDCYLNGRVGAKSTPFSKFVYFSSPELFSVTVTVLWTDFQEKIEHSIQQLFLNVALANLMNARVGG